MRTEFITLALLLRVVVSPADERIWVDAKINDKSARLIFDTGADRLILFRKGAERLGLSRSHSVDASFLVFVASRFGAQVLGGSGHGSTELQLG